MKIIKVNASFSLKKNLERFENADIWFSAEAEVGIKDKPEKVAQQLHDFCKKLAVEKYNSFTRSDLQGPITPSPTAETEYFNDVQTNFPKVYKSDAAKILKKLETHLRYPEKVYTSTIRGENGEANKVEITETMKRNNTSKPT